MRILAVGGGSGGHVTPIAAVLNELIKQDSSAEIRVWSDRSFHDKAVRTMKSVHQTVLVEAIYSGKFRRYHSLPVWKQLLSLRTIVLPNIRDSIYIALGTVQSLVKLLLWRPDVVFCKGGYVCLPVGIAAHVLKIPVVLHDSDVHPGLANRLLSKWAVSIGTGMPTSYYTYPKQKMYYVGVPIKAAYHRYSADEQAAFKASLGFEKHHPLVVITGGGLGSETLNDATVSVARELAEVTNVLLITGARQYDDVRSRLSDLSSAKFQVHDFVYENMAEVLAAADVVVTRAGATTLLELAALEKPIIIVPNPYLTGGHQIKNAQMYADNNAAVLVDEHGLVARPTELLDTVNALLLNKDQLVSMSQSIAQFARPKAAASMADLIVNAASSR